jgi:hypothetical protein
MSWNSCVRFLIISFGMLSGPGALLFDKFFSARSYTSFVKYSLMGVLGFPLFSSMNPSVSCHGYCLTRHVHFGGWSVGFAHTGTIGLNFFLCCIIFLVLYLPDVLVCHCCCFLYSQCYACFVL